MAQSKPAGARSSPRAMWWSYEENDTLSPKPLENLLYLTEMDLSCPLWQLRKKLTVWRDIPCCGIFLIKTLQFPDLIIIISGSNTLLFQVGRGIILMRHSRPSGFTLVELLVVIAIIGILVSMTMPAIQSARESGRRTQCLNNVRNIGSGCLQHLTANGHFPTGGWGYAWGGDPDRGFGLRQPGGWGYNILPFIEEKTLHDRGISGDPTTFNETKRAASQIRAKTVISLYLCPTRGRPGLDSGTWHGHSNLDLTGLTEIAKTDYAMNGGSANTGWPPGPGKDALAWDDKQFESKYAYGAALNADGVSHIRSMVREAHIKDGTSKTYLVGEKYLNFSTAGTSTKSGDDNQTWEVGFDWDTYRFTAALPQPDQNPDSTASNIIFGSAHLNGINMVFCDGSTKHIPYDIDLAVHQALGGRKDGGPTAPIPGQ
jgi:prepilin-type N-terminal cleavage/methylation domain-containing protein/prepilin-type processing-associated H-X9-DG protein